MKYKKQIVAISSIMIGLNILQLFFTQYFFEMRLNTPAFMAHLTTPEELNAIILHAFFGLLFGIVGSYLFVRYQESERFRSEEAVETVKKLETAYAGLRDLDKLKSKFITVVSHQIRTPLNSIRWNLEMILGGDLGKIKSNIEEFLRLTYKSNNQIISIIDDLLIAMDMEEGRLAIEKSPTELEGIAKSIFIEYAHDISIKKLKTKIIFEKSGVAEIDVDPIKFRQALSRVMDNAITFTSEGGHVTITISLTEKTAEIQVRDTGIGIPSAEMPHLFEKFYRASNAMKVHPDASGLGLYIAKVIIEKHDGTISIDSEEGKGTVVTITLPTARYA